MFDPLKLGVKAYRASFPDLYKFEAVRTEDWKVFCVGCLPEGKKVEDPEYLPIFKDDIWWAVPSCEICKKEHKYMNIL